MQSPQQAVDEGVVQVEGHLRTKGGGTESAGGGGGQQQTSALPRRPLAPDFLPGPWAYTPTQSSEGRGGQSRHSGEIGTADKGAALSSQGLSLPAPLAPWLVILQPPKSWECVDSVLGVCWECVGSVLGGIPHSHPAKRYQPPSHHVRLEGDPIPGDGQGGGLVGAALIGVQGRGVRRR